MLNIKRVNIGREKVIYKKKTNIEVESVYIEKPVVKKKKIRSKYFKMYQKAYENYRDIVNEGRVLRYNTAADRAQYVYEHPKFKEMAVLGEKIRKNEVVSLFVFFGVAMLLSIIAGYLAVFIENLIPIVSIPFIFTICGLIFFPRVSYKMFYVNIYMPIGYYCVDMHERKDELSFELKNKSVKPRKQTGKSESIINRFIIDTIESRTDVKRIVLSDIINNYRFEKGRLLISKKRATVFSGFEFDTQIKNIKNTKGANLKYAIINDETFYKISGLTDEELEKLEKENIEYSGLKNKGWNIYRDKSEVPLTAKKSIDIQKKILSMSKELGVFNVYVYENYIKILYSINFNREGIDPQKFESSISDDNSITYSGFVAIVKALCVLGFNEMLMTTFFGKKTLEQNHLVSEKQLNAKNNAGEIFVDTTINIIISLALAALVYVGMINIYQNYIKGNINNQAKITDAYEQSDSVSINYDYVE